MSFKKVSGAKMLEGALGVFHELPLFVMVTIVLQIPQTTVNCRFTR
jgi:hypothetical protein